MSRISWPTVIVTLVLYIVLMRVFPQVFAAHGPKAHYPVGPVNG